MGIHGPSFPVPRGISGVYFPYTHTRLKRGRNLKLKNEGYLDDVVSYLGINPEPVGRTYTVRRSWVLW